MLIAIASCIIGLTPGSFCSGPGDCGLLSRASGATILQAQEGDLLTYPSQSGTRKPKARIEGMTRGPEGHNPLVLPLVPDHVGLTIASQPALYWYLSKPTTSPIIFVLVDTRSIQVVHDITLSPQPQPGVQFVRLKDFGIVLEPNVQYRWYITVVIDAESPSRDIVSGGLVERVHPALDMPHGPPPTSDIASVRFYAENGLWYDALASISDLISAAPDNRLLRRQRASLLQQVGLQEVADWDLWQAGTDDIAR
jgi:hypothetical protein